MKEIIQSGLKFFLIFLVLYGALVAFSLIPAVTSASNFLYRKPTQSLIRVLLPQAHIQLKEGLESPHVIRVEYISKEKLNAYMKQRQAGAERVSVQGFDFQIYFFNIFLSFYILLLSLLILSPTSKREKLIGIVIGSILFYLFSLFRVYILLLKTFNEPAVGVYHSSESTMAFVDGILPYFTLSVNMLVVLLLWIFLSFRKGNWKVFLSLKR